MDMSGNAMTLALSVAALLLVAAVLAIPAVLRVIRLRRLQRSLGRLQWPLFLVHDEKAAIPDDANKDLFCRMAAYYLHDDRSARGSEKQAKPTGAL